MYTVYTASGAVATALHAKLKTVLLYTELDNTIHVNHIDYVNIYI